VQASICWNRRPDYFTKRLWRTESSNGGVLLNQASHFLDILLFLFGEPDSAAVRTGNIFHTISGEDSARGVIHFPGAVARFACTTAAPEGWNRASLRIQGTRNQVELGGKAWETFLHPLPSEIAGLESFLQPPVCGEHAGYFDRVARSLRGEAVDVVDADEGMRAVRLIDNLHRNAHRADEELAAYFSGVFSEGHA